MGLFSKKSCDICGGEIGLLGNRKLEDGNCCKECAKKLSPWFDERRHSTVDAIRQQLAYREENKSSVAAFHCTRTFGNGYQVLMIDENTRKFCVGGKDSLVSGNPDIVDISAITGYEMIPDESRHELYRKDREGNNVSYNPPKYEYRYDFDYVIRVDHPYFDDMKFRLNSQTVVLREASSSETFSGVLGMLQGQQNQISRMNPEYDRYVNMGNEITAVISALRNGSGYGSQGMYDQGMNGQAMYGQGMNGQTMNGQAMYGQGMNGQGMNGQAMYGQGMNSQAMYGQGMNGQTMNGQGMNGQAMYGQGMNGQTMNGQGMNGQNMYGQEMSMQQQGMGMQQGMDTQNAAGAWTCPFCGTQNTGSFCCGCGSKRS